jgi:hypothetical protein
MESEGEVARNMAKLSHRSTLGGSMKEITGFLRSKVLCRAQWHTPVIPTTWEAEVVGLWS